MKKESSSLTEILSKKRGKNSRGKLDIEEEKESDKAATEQQLRAYKRQVDDLRQQLDNQKEKYEKSTKDLEAQVCYYIIC